MNDNNWPFKPGDTVRDSGQDGDDAAWLLAAPEGTVVRDYAGLQWVQGKGLWLAYGTPARFVDLQTMPYQVLAQRGPLVVEAVA